jgi:hypothetical protein
MLLHKKLNLKEGTMKTNNKLLIVLFWGLFSVVALQQTNSSMADDSIQQLHIFEHNEKALADEVNQNFTYLDNKISIINSQLSLNKQQVGIGIDIPNAYLHVLNEKADNINLLLLEFKGGNVGQTSDNVAMLRVVSDSLRRPLMSLYNSHKIGGGSFNITPRGEVIMRSGLSSTESNQVIIQLEPNINGATRTRAHIIAQREGTSNYNSKLMFRTSNSSTGAINSTTKMTIASNGNVTINGNLYSNNLKTMSDIQLKKDIKPLINSLEKISLLKGVSYYWKTEEYPHKNFDDIKQIGLIAQEVEPIIPEIVRTDTDGYKSISYDRLTAVLVEAVKELKTNNEKQDQLINALSEQNRIFESIICEDHPEKDICQ